MIGTIRKHQKWLWAVIITLTITSFVIFFSPYSKMNSSRRVKVDYGSIYGRRVSEQEFSNAGREVYLRSLMFTGRWPDEQVKQNLDRETYQWLFICRKQDLMGIHIGQDRLADVARQMIGGLQRAGVSSPADLAKLLELNHFSMDDFERFVAHYIGLQEMMLTLGASGRLSTPDDIKGLYIREHQELATELLLFNASNYISTITVTPDAVQQFYTNDMSNYRIPERVQVDCLTYPISNYLAQAEQFLMKTNFNELIDRNYAAAYERFGTNLYKETMFKGAKTPEEAKQRIREEVIRGEASFEARKVANALLSPLLAAPKQTLEALTNAAKAAGLALHPMEPFSRENPPKDLEGNEEFASAAFGLTPEYPLAGSFRGKDFVYIIALNHRVPSEIPPLDKIRDRVVADYRLDQAKGAARSAGMNFFIGATNGLAQGKTFDALCAEARLKPITLPPFSISTRTLPEVEELLNLNSLKQLAFTTTPGKVSGFQWTAEGGVILFVKAKLPLDEARENAELPGFGSAVRQQRTQEAFQAWFEPEFTRNVRALPLSQPQRQPAQPASASKGARKS